MAPPDAELARWFAEEVQPHEPALRAWLRSRFPTLGDADDLVQEAYARLLRVRETGSVACPRAFVRLMESDFGLRAEWRENGEIVLRRTTR
jgi:DNA-directed RNA polymerase specialized sigma24 family protein